MKNGNGSITIYRTYGEEERPMVIEIRDESGRVIRLRMTLEQFASAITGHAGT